MLRHRSALLLAVAVLAHAAPATDLDQLRTQPDPRALIRASFGVRTARALSPTRVELVLGLSSNDTAGVADAWRVVSEGDPAYAFARFVRPATAAVRREVELAGARPFERRLVTLDLPNPLQAGKDYQFIAQGSGDQPVTGARTAAGLVFGQTAPPAGPAADLAVLALRAVRPLAPALVQLELGPAFDPAPGMKPEQFTVTVGGQPAKVLDLGRHTTLDTYLPEGWPYQAIVQHEVFLKLDRPFAAGDEVRVEVAAAACAGDAVARTAGFRFDPLHTWTPSLHANQIGYVASSAAKVAYLGRWLGSFPEVAGGRGTQNAAWFGETVDFTVCRAADGRQVFAGHAALVHRSGEMTEGAYHQDHSGENVYRLEFGAVTQPGRYVLSVAGAGCSMPFEIGADALRPAYAVAAYGVFAQRCGLELGPPFSAWRRIACHRQGVLPTTVERMAPYELGDLAQHIDYSRGQRAQPSSEQARLDHDPALAGWWRLDGDFADASGQGHTLQPLRPGQAFTPDTTLLPGNNQCFGPTDATLPLGAEAKLTCDPSAGYTLAGWLRHRGQTNFDGVLCGFPGTTGQPRLALTANWGLVRAIVGQGQEVLLGRADDGRWHHFAVTVTPDRHVTGWLDGQNRGETQVQAPLGGETFQLAAITGKELPGKHVDDVRIYRRALTAAEIGVLATRWVEKASRLDAYGGHHDAGDYNPRAHLDVAQTLMDAFEMRPRAFPDGQLNIPERANGLPDILDEAAWSLRVWDGLQDEDGGVWNGTESDGDPNFIQTAELDPKGDYAFAKDAAGSLNIAGAWAQASRLWKSAGKTAEAEGMLARARRAYAWANAHRPKAANDRERYDRFDSPRAYAAAELLHTTGEPAFAHDFAESCVWRTKADAPIEIYQVYDQKRAALAYAKVPAAQADAKLQAACRRGILAMADEFIAGSSTMAYRFVRHPQAPLTWGTGAYEHNAIPVLWAWSLTGDDRYRTWLTWTVDNTLGANPLGLCWITGLGSRPIHAPLHNSRYGQSGEVAPGMQSEGPNARGEGYRVTEVTFPKLRDDFASLHTFADCHFAISMDEGVVSAQAETMAVLGVLADLGAGH